MDTHSPAAGTEFLDNRWVYRGLFRPLYTHRFSLNVHLHAFDGCHSPLRLSSSPFDHTSHNIQVDRSDVVVDTIHELLQ
jgi:hypothetical protein